MEDLDIITKVMEQHKVLLNQINSVSETMSDLIPNGQSADGIICKFQE